MKFAHLLELDDLDQVGFATPSVSNLPRWRGDSEAGEPPKEEEEEQKVTLLELFSDLTFVVAIHVVAVPLEEEADVFGTPLALFFLRVFVLWQAWYGGTVYTNIANLFTEGSDKLRPRHYVAVLLLMTLMTLISQSTQRADDRGVIVYFLAARLLLWFGLLYESRLSKPDDMLEARYKAIRKLFWNQTYTSVVEVSLLSLATSQCEPDGAASAVTLRVWGLASALLVLTHIMGSRMKDRDRHHLKNEKKTAIDLDSFNEWDSNYSLLTTYYLSVLLTTYYLLLTAYYSLLTTYYCSVLHTTDQYYSLHTTYYSLLTTDRYYSLLTIDQYYSLLTTHYSLLTTYRLLLTT